VGGTNPSLLEAMACQSSIIAHDNQFNKAVLGTDARYFLSANDILSLIEAEEFLKERVIPVQNNLDKIYRIYNWDKVIKQYEELFENVINIIDG
jgi:glycosyltransferase involved in cell wall biosynthesis